MKTITTHLTLSGGVPLAIETRDEPGAGGAHAAYDINGFPSDPLKIRFQTGDPRVAINGITNEALLAILIDRQQDFQSGPFPSPEGGEALKHLKAALAAMHRRTTRRVKAGVEGQAVADPKPAAKKAAPAKAGTKR